MQFDGGKEQGQSLDDVTKDFLPLCCCLLLQQATLCRFHQGSWPPRVTALSPEQVGGWRQGLALKTSHCPRLALLVSVGTARGCELRQREEGPGEDEQHPGSGAAGEVYLPGRGQWLFGALRGIREAGLRQIPGAHHYGRYGGPSAAGSGELSAPQSFQCLLLGRLVEDHRTQWQLWES